MRFASPVLDILFYISISTDREERETEYGDLLRTYYEQLSSNIRKMGSDPDALYSYDDFMDGFRLCGNFGLLVAPVCLLYRCIDDEDLANMRNFNDQTQSDAIKVLSEESQRKYKHKVLGVIEDFCRLGYFRELQ